MKRILLLAISIPQIVFAGMDFYPQALVQKIEKRQIKDQELETQIFDLLSKNHKSLTYKEAKRFLFGQLHLKNGPEGYYVHDVYCKKDFTSGVGPGSVPDQNKVNCEHTWPQSKFTSSFPANVQQSDLHHLFPTDSRANSTRGNYDFADVSENRNISDDECTSSKSGPSVTTGGNNYFEPPSEHKGNVARALFYFAVRYKMEINKDQEEFLRRWDKLDPIDDEERARNEQIEKIQKTRNPFVDFEGLADQVSNF